MAISSCRSIFPFNPTNLKKNDIICKTYKQNNLKVHKAATDLFFDNISKFINFLNTDCLSKNSIHITYVDNMITINSENANVLFTEKVGYILGVKPNVKIDRTTSTNVDIFGGIYNIYVYLNIITTQYVGDVRVNLLKTISIDRTSNYTHAIFENPYYLDIYHSHLLDLNVAMRTLTGEIIKFPSGLVTLTLHLRKK